MMEMREFSSGGNETAPDMFSNGGAIWTQLQEIADTAGRVHNEETGGESGSTSSSSSSSDSLGNQQKLGIPAVMKRPNPAANRSSLMSSSAEGRLSPMVLSKPSHNKLKQHLAQQQQQQVRRLTADFGYHTMSPPPPPPVHFHQRPQKGEIVTKTTPPSTASATTSTSSPNSSIKTNSSSSDLWDVRATKTPISELHILTYNAKRVPVTRKTFSRASSAASTVSYRDHFQSLPDAVIAHILSFLPFSNDLAKCSRVCRRFYVLSWEPELWKTVALNGEETVDVDLGLKTIFRLLARNAASGGKQQLLPSLESIVLGGCERLTDRGLALIARRCPQLRHLELQHCVNVTNGGLMDLVTKCTFLDHLDVSGCSMISTIGVHQPPPTPVPHHHHLQPRRGMSSPSPLLFRRQLNIQYLDLTDCVSLEDTGLKMVVESCPNLLYLFLRRCVNVTDVGLKYVASYCLSLREFSISDCVQITDFGLYELAKLGPNLRYLSVAKCDRISDSGVKQIAKLCYKLRYLNVRGCEAVSDDAIEMVSRSCTRLRSLDIGKCDVTDVGLKMLSENCPNLKKLSVKSCEMVSDQGIMSIAYYCRGLQQLNIQDSPITVEGYRTVKKYCRRCIIEHSNPGFF